MTTEAPLTDSDRGYLSAESKRRFTLVAGVLGAVFFLAQMVLPVVLMFLIMVPTMVGHEFTITDLDGAALWRDELWFMQRTKRVNWRDPENPAPAAALARVRLSDLSSAGPALPLPRETDPDISLLPVGDRLWMIGASEVGYYNDGSFTRLSGAVRPSRPSRPFVLGGHPAVISLGTTTTLAMLRVDGGQAAWETRELDLGLRPEDGSLHALRAVEANGRLYLFAEQCTETPDLCSLRYRELEQGDWLPVVDEFCSCGTWTAMVLDSRPTVFLSEPEEKRQPRLALVTIGADGPRRDRIELDKTRRMAFDRWRPFSSGSRLVLVTEGMPGSLKLTEVAAGRVVRSVRRAGSVPFPFGGGMMLFMVVPQVLPLVLSLILASILTGQMRRHRVQEYAFEGRRRRFASLWQRALAQLVDLVPFMVGFLVPGVWWWRFFSDPERIMESGPWFPLLFFGLAIAAFAWALLVLVAFSYLEGRFGKTPGKWLLHIRVLGTDLRPCGFRRAFLRNLLTFVDGFFSFLVGALLVALTENWQRLGDLAARTIVVADAKPAGQG